VPWYAGDRRKVLADLDAWADDPTCHVGVKLLHAAGGVGKTRLAIEWVQRRRSRDDRAGFLVPKLDGSWLERLCGLGPPVLIVIDYAERRGDSSISSSEWLHSRRGTGPSSRPDPAAGAQRWRLVDGPACRSGNLGALLGDVVPHKLSPLAATARIARRIPGGFDRGLPRYEAVPTPRSPRSRSATRGSIACCTCTWPRLRPSRVLTSMRRR